MIKRFDKRGQESNLMLVYQRQRFFLYFQGLLYRDFSCHMISHMTSLYSKIKTNEASILNYLGIWTAHVDKGVSGLHNSQFTFWTQLITLDYLIILSHRRSTTVSSETYPLYSFGRPQTFWMLTGL